jgi:AcrR family transcriptional regulator
MRTSAAAPGLVPTRERILDAALDLFGSRGVDAVSLDDIAAGVGVRKQTVLYWFPSKDDLLAAVVENTAEELATAVEAALRHAGPGFARVEAVVNAVFRPAVRRPAVLGLLHELNRLGPDAADRLLARARPLVARAVSFLEAEMAAGRMRRGDPAVIVALAYATVTGVATGPEVLRAVGWQPTAAGLRALRRELLAFLRAALAPPDPARRHGSGRGGRDG